MTKTLPEFREKFGLEELTITTTEHWTWSVRPLQPTLGCTVLSLNRLCPTFGEMTEQEALDFGRVVRLVEARVGEAWAPDRFNYLMYMLVDEHVHFHVLARYAGGRRFADVEWVDTGWPRPLDPLGGGRRHDELLLAVRTALAP